MCQHSRDRFKITQKRINFIMMSKTFSKDEVQLRVSGKDEEKRENKGLIKIRQERAGKN